MKIGQRVKVVREAWGDPILNPITGAEGTITEVAEPCSCDPGERIRYEVTFDEPRGSQGYKNFFPFYDDDLADLEG